MKNYTAISIRARFCRGNNKSWRFTAVQRLWIWKRGVKREKESEGKKKAWQSNRKDKNSILSSHSRFPEDRSWNRVCCSLTGEYCACATYIPIIIVPCYWHLRGNCGRTHELHIRAWTAQEFMKAQWCVSVGGLTKNSQLHLEAFWFFQGPVRHHAADVFPVVGRRRNHAILAGHRHSVVGPGLRGGRFVTFGRGHPGYLGSGESICRLALGHRDCLRAGLYAHSGGRVHRFGWWHNPKVETKKIKGCKD